MAMKNRQKIMNNEQGIKNKELLSRNKEQNDDNVTRNDSQKIRGKILDVFVVILCLSGMAVSLYLFQNDFFMSLRSMNIDPVGIVSIKFNTVQRRLQDRMIWDRLIKESPVYNGDLIRIARHSGAMLDLDNNYVSLGENTLIRVEISENTFLIDFMSGEIDITSSMTSKPVFLSIGDKVVEAVPGSVFGAVLSKEGTVLRVTDGSARIVQDGVISELPAGSVVVQDPRGNEIKEPMAAVFRPGLNARFLKTGAFPLNVEFSWARINMKAEDRLRLEIAENRSFSSITHSFNNLNSSVSAAINSGVWYWRLSLMPTAETQSGGGARPAGKVLTSGRLTVTDAQPASPVGPYEGYIYNAGNSNPEVQLRWSAIPDASYYSLQVSSSPDFSNLKISVNVYGTSYIKSNLEPGRWYWRVRPVLPSVFEGETQFSAASYFLIEKSARPAAPSLGFPLAESAVVTSGERDIYFSWAAVREAAFYTFLISKESDLSAPLLKRVTKNNYYILNKDNDNLTPGKYYWSVFYTDSRGADSAVPPSRAFIAAENVIVQKLIFPPDGYKIEDSEKESVIFTWESNLSQDKRFQVSSNVDFSGMEIDKEVNSNSFKGISVAPGEWYWRVTGRTEALSVLIPSLSRRFTMSEPPVVLPEDQDRDRESSDDMPALPLPLQQPAAQPGPQPAAQIPPQTGAARGQTRARTNAQPRGQPRGQTRALPPSQPPTLQTYPYGGTTAPLAAHSSFRITLLTPAQGLNIPGLTAIREPVIFRWDTKEAIASSRFMLSRTANPAEGRPDIVIQNPNREIKINRLDEGTWYWTVEGTSPDGKHAAPEAAGFFHVLPIPFLPSPAYLLPQNNFTIGIEELKAKREIVFIWSEVEGANGYILTILREGNPRRQIFQSDPLKELSLSFDKLQLLENHDTIYWHVEALIYDDEGRIEQRGQIKDFSITLNVPTPGRVRARKMGILYGTE